MRSSKCALLLAITVLGTSCSDDSSPLPDPEQRVAIERDFLAATEGEWTGVLSETAALDKRVMRETPMRLLVDPEDSPLVGFPILGCRGNLLPAPDASPPSTNTTLRLLQHVTPVKAGSVCQPGPVRLVRGAGTEESGDTLEYTYLGDTLRRIQATLRRLPKADMVGVGSALG